MGVDVYTLWLLLILKWKMGNWRNAPSDLGFTIQVMMIIKFGLRRYIGRALNVMNRVASIDLKRLKSIPKENMRKSLFIRVIAHILEMYRGKLCKKTLSEVIQKIQKYSDIASKKAELLGKTKKIQYSQAEILPRPHHAPKHTIKCGSESI